jgi:ligand-binding sensor protein
MIARLEAGAPGAPHNLFVDAVIHVMCGRSLMKLTDIASLESWVALERAIAERSGLNANVFDTEGIRISEFRHWNNRLCPAIKAIDKGQSYICAVAHSNVATLARQGREPVIEECDAGLVKLVVPIYLDDEFLGVVGGCGHLLDDGEVDSFMINRTTDIAEETVAELAQGIGRIRREEAEALAGYIQQEIAGRLDTYRRGRHGA